MLKKQPDMLSLSCPIEPLAVIHCSLWLPIPTPAKVIATGWLLTDSASWVPSVEHPGRAIPTMGLSTVLARAQLGVDAPLITIETHLGAGLPCFSIVGLPETAVREARDRVKSALQNSGFLFPQSRITVNLAPADLPKEGGRFDLGIAVGILLASDQLPANALKNFEILGELGLSGNVRGVRGCLSAAINAQALGHGLILPSVDYHEARLIKGLQLIPAANLVELAAWSGNCKQHPRIPGEPASPEFQVNPDLQDIKGQPIAKRALQVAAAGGHHLLLRGPPGTGKTMLARYLSLLLPPPREEEAMAAIQIHSAAGYSNISTLLNHRPFRVPHHSTSAAAMIGGGRPVQPGEISLAHNGLLFLDELPEFNRQVLESLREPLESGEVVIARVNNRIRFPARFQLVAAMNPCPVGRSCTPLDCLCSEAQLRRYLARLSAPLLDRIDMQVAVPPLPKELLFGESAARDSSAVTQRRLASDLARQRVTINKAVKLQVAHRGKLNRDLSSLEVDQYCPLSKNEKTLFLQAIDKFELSVRGCHRVLKVARTIADLGGDAVIEKHHLTEALGYRAASTM